MILRVWAAKLESLQREKEETDKSVYKNAII